MVAPTPVRTGPLPWLNVGLIELKSSPTGRARDGFKRLDGLLALSNESLDWRTINLSNEGETDIFGRVIDSKDAEHRLEILGDYLDGKTYQYYEQLPIPPNATVVVKARVQIPEQRDAVLLRVQIAAEGKRRTLELKPDLAPRLLFRSETDIPEFTGKVDVDCQRGREVSLYLDSFNEGSSISFKVRINNSGGAPFSLNPASFRAVVYAVDGTWFSWNVRGWVEGTRSIQAVPDRTAEATFTLPVYAQADGFSGKKPLLIRMSIKPYDASLETFCGERVALFMVQ